jgi:hypothetical protein
VQTAQANIGRKFTHMHYAQFCQNKTQFMITLTLIYWYSIVKM